MIHPTAIQSDETRSTPGTVGASRVLDLAIWALLIPPFLAYVVAAVVTSVNIPFGDDFDSIGDFVEQYASLHGFFARLSWVLTAQHVQYKLMLLDAVAAAQYHLIGHINYRALQLLGDVAIPASVVVLWFMLARSHRPLQQRMWLFVTPCWVFFGLRYSETVNWAMSGLQNTAVIPLALAAIFFGTSTRRRSLIWGLVFLSLSIAASGSGFVISIVLVYLFVRERRWVGAVLTVAITLLVAVLYAVHYAVIGVYDPVSRAAAVKSLALFPLAFLGNAAYSPVQAVTLGMILVAVFLLLTWKGWRIVCPASFGGALFCLITSVIVAGGRYRGGYELALTGHYIMYSVLLIALEYLAMVRLFAPRLLRLRSGWTAGLALAAVASFAFCLWADDGGYRNLHARQREQITHLILWERHPDRIVLVPDEVTELQKPKWLPTRIKFQDDLTRHIAAGLYRPPYLASDPVPIRPHSPATLGLEDEVYMAPTK